MNDQTIRIAKLIDAICESWCKCLPQPYGDSGFMPDNGTTYCNMYVSNVLDKFGYNRFIGLKANEIVDLMTVNQSEWMEVNGEVAQYHANNGAIVIAGWKNPDGNQHGHVSVVRPGMLTTSGKWKSEQPNVPKLANVGKRETCRIDRGSNYAFKDQPKYFCLKSTIIG